MATKTQPKRGLKVYRRPSEDVSDDEADYNHSEEQKELESNDDAMYKPQSNHVNALLTDLYQITMCYAYWKNKHTEQPAVFDLFFRKCPFKGAYTIFAGLDDVLRFLNTFGYTKQDIEALKSKFPDWDIAFWEYLSTVNGSQLSVYAQREGSVCFPRIPLIRIEGPVAVCQLIETTLLNLVNYASLLTTNACRIRQSAGPNKSLLEFGLRRAQGPDGAMSASKYAYIGGFDGTSNVLAGILNNIPIKGTHAHSFVSSYTGLDMLNKDALQSLPVRGTDESKDNDSETFLDLVLKYRTQLQDGNITNEGELAAFIAYAVAFPSGFLALVDTYDTLNSGIPNFIAVSLALNDIGYKPIGIRLDSGDLAFLSKEARKYFKHIAQKFNVSHFEKLVIVASNDINEEVLHALNKQGHEIDSFGIGTHLVTCKRQPALGCVYKLVAINGEPRIKISQSRSKMTIPGKKMAYRLWVQSRGDEPILDLLALDTTDKSTKQSENTPQVGKPCICEDPFNSSQRCRLTPSKVESLLIPVYVHGKVVHKSPSLSETRAYCQEQVQRLRSDHVRHLNPTPYKIAVSTELRDLTEKLWRAELPVAEYD